MSETIRKVYHLGQSLWYDNIQRRLLENSALEKLIYDGSIYGITSNPSIFQKAIAETSDYDDSIQCMAWAGLSANEIFYELAIADIQAAADLFQDVFRQSKGKDGYVSLEVNPFLAKDTEATIGEALLLWQKVNRPNLMVKIPATKEGLPAVRRCIAEGLNINVTLIFSIQRYAEVIDAYLSGLEDRAKQGLPIDQIASVASFFVSRVDNKVDALLQKMVEAGKLSIELQKALSGTAAIANSRLAYHLFNKQFTSPRFLALKQMGANIQRPLWASTSTKNPAYPDILYVQGLIIADTVNTVPPATLSAFSDHGVAELGFSLEKDRSEEQIARLTELGIDMNRVTAELEIEGVNAFSTAFEGLLETLEKKASALKNELGDLHETVANSILEHKQNKTIQRLYEKDPALWTDDPEQQKEILDRLGWLDLPQSSREILWSLNKVKKELFQTGIHHALLLGMGGSSLAPEVISSVFSDLSDCAPESLTLTILDSTNPIEVKKTCETIDFKKTVFIVASKSGTTTEVIALMNFFWEKSIQVLGKDTPGHFIAITDPGTWLEKTAKERGFRNVFSSNPQVGGRFSALTHFGLFPATLIGVDTRCFLERAEKEMHFCQPSQPDHSNPGLLLGILMAQAVKNGKNKITFLADPQLVTFGSWLEQLIAESSGKHGKGIIPVDLEPIGNPEDYQQDRLFIYLRHKGAIEKQAESLQKAGFPLVRFTLKDINDLAAQFYRWEVATAIACACLNVNAFDQPDVQDSKTRTKAKVEILKTGGATEDHPDWQNHSATLYWKNLPRLKEETTLNDLFAGFLSTLEPGDYLAINAYLSRTITVVQSLQALRKAIRAKYGVATTLGFGPRFLHSTGQLHKGGPNVGKFLLLTEQVPDPLEIPGEGLSFNQLILAQAAGDKEALLARGRNVFHIHFKDTGNQAILNDLV